MGIVPQFLEGAAYGVLNDVISSFNSNEGYAQPNKYEVMIFPPTPPPTRGENYSTGKISLINLLEGFRGVYANAIGGLINTSYWFG